MISKFNFKMLVCKSLITKQMRYASELKPELSLMGTEHVNPFNSHDTISFCKIYCKKQMVPLKSTA